MPPMQHWLDGIAKADGKVLQFVAASVGSGYRYVITDPNSSFSGMLHEPAEFASRMSHGS